MTKDIEFSSSVDDYLSKHWDLPYGYEDIQKAIESLVDDETIDEDELGEQTNICLEDASPNVECFVNIRVYRHKIRVTYIHNTWLPTDDE